MSSEINNSKNSIIYKITGTNPADNELLISRIKEGLTCNSVSLLSEAYRCDQALILEVLSIPLSSMKRRTKKGKLNQIESEKVVRLASIIDTAIALMNGNEDAAASWMKTPKIALGGESPLQYSSTEIGGNYVIEMIQRIKHGVFF